MPERSTNLSNLKSSSEIATLYSLLGNSADLHVVGGTLRDLLLGKDGIDLDLATHLRPDELKNKLSSAGIRSIDTGIEHGTITALIENSSIEITTFRQAGPRNIAKFSDSILEDLKGRDFTINAIAYSLNSDSIIDPFNGIQDLEDNILRCVGDPEDRFKEDPLRILRAIRFSSAACRELDPETKAAALSLAHLVKNVSVERIAGELRHILLEEDPSAGMSLFKELGLLEHLIPEFLAMVGFEQNDFHIHDVWEHTLWVLSRSERDIHLRLAALFHDSGKPATFSVDENGKRHFYLHELESEKIVESVLGRLRFSNSDVGIVKTLVRYHMRPIQCGPVGCRRLLRDLGEEFSKWRLLKIADSPPKQSEEEFKEELASFDALVCDELEKAKGSPFDSLCVNGEELKEIGFQEGKLLGSCLNFLLEKVLDDPSLNRKELLLGLAKDYLSESRS